MNKNLSIFLLMLVFVFSGTHLAFAKRGFWRVEEDQKRKVQEEQKKVEEKKIQATQKARSENKSALKNTLKENTLLNEAQKKDLADYFSGQYEGNISVKDEKTAQDIATFQKIADDPTINQAQKKTAIKKYIENKNKTKPEDSKEADSKNKAKAEK